MEKTSIVIIIAIIICAVLLIVVLTNPVDMETQGSSLVNGAQNIYNGYSSQFVQENTKMENTLEMMDNVQK